MTAAVEGFTGLEHALEPVAEIGGVRFVNDSKATNIDAARRAIESFARGWSSSWVGASRAATFATCCAPLVERRRRRRHRRVASAHQRGAADAVSLHEAVDMSAAVRMRVRVGAPGRTVVLAPACASFDMFRDYAERGRVFKQEVRKLQDEWSTTREQ